MAVGPGDDPASEMGPLITLEHRDRVASYLDIGAEEGATVIIDGRQHPNNGEEGGYWLGPSLIDEVSPGMQVYRDEIFGPVLSVVRVESLDDALELDPDQWLWQWSGHLHFRWRRGPTLRDGGRSRDGGHQRGHPRSGFLLFLRRLAGLTVR